MRRITKLLRRHPDGVRSIEVQFPDGVPKYKSILTDEDRRQIAEVKRLCGD